MDLLNWVPDRWFKLFQDYISNHFAHIAKLAFKKGKELICCISISSELLTVKDIKRRKSQEGCLKNALLKVANVRYDDNLQLHPSPQFECEKWPHYDWQWKHILLPCFINDSDGIHGIRSVKSAVTNKTSYSRKPCWWVTQFTTILEEQGFLWQDFCCSEWKGSNICILFHVKHGLITRTTPNFYFLLQLQLTGFFI